MEKTETISVIQQLLVQPCSNKTQTKTKMFSKILVVFVVVAAAAAITPGYLDGAYSLGAQSEHTVRGFAGLSSVSKQQKAIHGPYSSSQKTDIRVTNDGYNPGYLAHGYHAPIAHVGHAAPIAHAYSASHAHGYASLPHAASPYHGYHAAPAFAPHGYSAPHTLHYSPASAVAHASFSGFGVNYGY